jgi:hypothetical protein
MKALDPSQIRGPQNSETRHRTALVSVEGLWKPPDSAGPVPALLQLLRRIFDQSVRRIGHDGMR